MIGGRSSTLSLVLENPTFVDALSGVDTLSLTIHSGGEDIYTEWWNYPSETPELPDLTDFGVVSFQVVGLGGGRILSAGRTPPMMITVAQDQQIPVLFLPVNEALPLRADLATRRNHHAAELLPDGRVVLLGGRDPSDTTSLDSVEVYDPTDSTFRPVPASLPEAIADPQLAWTPEHTLIIAGGSVLIGGGVVGGSTSASVFDPRDNSVDTAGSMTEARAGHCFAMYAPHEGAVFGGTDEENKAERLRQDEDGEHWAFTQLKMEDMPQDRVTGCVAATGGQVYVQGIDSDSTGLFDFTDPDRYGGDPTLAFTPISSTSGAEFGEGRVLIPLEDGSVWAAGGLDTFRGVVLSAGGIYSVFENRFAGGIDLAYGRVDGRWTRWDEDWYAVGCGYRDASRSQANASVELVSPGTGVSLPPIELDKDRPGCDITGLLDGTILVTGGYDGAGDTAPGAALIRPWNTE